MTDNTQPADDIELLLPWRATGRLNASDAQRVDAALAADPDLRRKYALVQEEMSETVAANEALDAPSVRARNRLFEQIAAEGKTTSAQGVMARIVDFFGSLTPRAVAMSAAAAALVIAIQAGVLTRNLMEPATTFHTASTSQGVEDGAYALVAFTNEATARQMADLLEGVGATIVDGPRSGGVYLVRIATKRIEADEMTKRLAALTARREIVRFAVPSQQK